MSLWFVLALMTLAAVFAVVWPLRRTASADARAPDLAVYKDQLAELERDVDAGLVPPREAEAARVEIARRLLAAEDARKDEERAARSEGAPLWRRRAVTLAACAFTPLLGLGLYAALGSPSIPDAPLSARNAGPPEGRSIHALVAQVESHLETHPDDGRGWEVLAPVYLTLERFPDAVRARQNALRLNGPTAPREADLGEALIYAAGGVVTAEAKAAFERSLALDGKNVKARYFLGLAAEQDGRAKEAAEIWRALLADAPPDAPWAEAVRQSLARLAPAVAAALGPSREDVAAAEGLAPAERNEMIRGMVERLATRLQQDGSDIEGWLRLMRAYVVLGENGKAKAAAGDARKAMAQDPAKLRRVEDMAKSLGLES